MALPSRASSSLRTHPAGRILALDYGRKRIGLAVSDELGLTARPLATLVRMNRRADLRRLRAIVREHNIRRVVMGQPLHLDGRSSAMAEEVARFAARIGKELQLPVELVDERLTSWAAEEVAAEVSSSSRKRGHLDSLAAAVLLRDYLERAREQKSAKAED
jgi:putative Holliday junction resolvase